MLIDCHSHIDLFDDPISITNRYEKTDVLCIMMTMLPEHFQMAIPHLKNKKYIKSAIGMHPIYSSEAEKQIGLFGRLLTKTSYIGEIGLDLSSEGRSSKATQISVLKHILPLIRENKFVSVHSRGAHEEMGSLLEEHRVSPVCFHYYTGSVNTLYNLLEKGHYFSVNSRMISSKRNPILKIVPPERILVETDGPFLTKDPVKMIHTLYSKLSDIWGKDIETTFEKNFKNCRTLALTQNTVT